MNSHSWEQMYINLVVEGFIMGAKVGKTTVKYQRMESNPSIHFFKNVKIQLLKVKFLPVDNYALWLHCPVMWQFSHMWPFKYKLSKKKTCFWVILARSPEGVEKGSLSEDDNWVTWKLDSGHARTQNWGVVDLVLSSYEFFSFLSKWLFENFNFLNVNSFFL